MDSNSSMDHATLIPATSQAVFDKYVSSAASSTLLVIYFEAPWASPCAQMSTVLSTLASTYKSSEPRKVVFLAVNTDDLPEIAETYEVTAVPYIVLQRDGERIDTISGGDATKVRDAVENQIGTGSGNSSANLPPAQSVTRPERQSAPLLSETASMANGTKNLSSYAPSSGNSSSGAKANSKDSNEPANAPLIGEAKMEQEDLNTRLSKLVKAAPVMLFMKGTPSAPQCGFSRQLVGLLRENGVRYGFFNILADEEVRQGLKAFADWPTFPQLWLSGDLVGGLDIVREEMENDPDFFAQYSVDTTNRNTGGPANADQQAKPTATA